jgi:hypothetical protein
MPVSDADVQLYVHKTTTYAYSLLQLPPSYFTIRSLYLVCNILTPGIYISVCCKVLAVLSLAFYYIAYLIFIWPYSLCLYLYILY